MAHDQVRGCCSDGEWVSGYNPARSSRESCQQHAQSGNFFGFLLGVDTTFFLMPAAAGEGRTNQGTGTPYCIGSKGWILCRCYVLTT